MTRTVFVLFGIFTKLGPAEFIHPSSLMGNQVLLLVLPGLRHTSDQNDKKGQHDMETYHDPLLVKVPRSLRTEAELR